MTGGWPGGDSRFAGGGGFVVHWWGGNEALWSDGSGW